jgi:LEA14-like dessication related protein
MLGPARAPEHGSSARARGRQSSFVRASGVWCALLLAACAGPLTSDVEPPEVSLAGLAMSRPGLFEQELRVDLRLRNPNDFAIGIERVRFALEVNDKTFANGRTNQAFELPALGEAVVPVTVSVPTNDLIDRLMEVGSERRLEYRLSGEAELDSLLFGTLPFERDGSLTLPAIPGLAAPAS